MQTTTPDVARDVITRWNRSRPCSRSTDDIGRFADRHSSRVQPPYLSCSDELGGIIHLPQHQQPRPATSSRVNLTAAKYIFICRFASLFRDHRSGRLLAGSDCLQFPLPMGRRLIPSLSSPPTRFRLFVQSHFIYLATPPISHCTLKRSNRQNRALTELLTC